MALVERLQQDLITALKGGEAARVSTLRLLKNGLENQRIAKGEELTESESEAVLQKEAKQRRDSIASFAGAGRDDLVQKETAELKITESYLPKALTASELEKIIDFAIKESNASSMADMGKIMGIVTKQTGSSADGAQIAALVRERLQNSRG